MRLLRPTWVEINLDYIKHNYIQIKESINKNVKIGAVLKANAYGHGAVEVAKLLEEENVDYICVAGLNEAIELRNENINSKILVMGDIPSDFIKLAIKEDVIITIFSYSYVKLVSEVAKDLNKVAKIHIKINTGFNRLGFDIDNNTSNIIHDIYRLPNIYIDGIYSHLALKDIKSDYTQYELFKKCLDSIKDINIPIKHICDSIGMVEYKNLNMDMVRVGSSLYGYNSRKTNMQLKPAMTFKSKITQIRNIKRGQGISYDYTFIAPKNIKIGTIPCGYSDGIPRLLSNQGFVSVNGYKANIIGKMCMDQCMIDLSNVKCAKENDEVIFYGNDGPKLLDVSKFAQTNRNEILSLVSRRVPRVYLKNNKVYKIVDYIENN
ncbi:alanine racemase [Clostridium sp. CCUG 7971]|uniref:alanine racemase n=1 Tax=Clostridium sp. CCUG 7971 TaxID=2811414 RepID=UPI001ABAD7F0|nr:alanine racemase [Clostridium sp. CCUG 7971]MBO3446438.1 alanine racemase [Clostridium sp. CCUG 7971]